MRDVKPQTPRLTRRGLLQTGLSLAVFGALGGGMAGCTGGGTGVVENQTPDPQPTPDALFVQPEVLSSSNGLLEVTLPVMMGTRDLNGLQINTRTYFGQTGAPTLKIRPGDKLRITVDNQLPPNPDPDPPDINIPHHFNTTNLHTHGLHVSPTQDDVFTSIEPGQQLTYEYDIPADHPCGTFWYHPHRHGSATMQLFGGMAGALIVQGGADEVPEISAAEDLVFVITELNINQMTGMTPNFVAGPVFPNTFPANTICVNGEFSPTLTVWPGQVVRLRIVNGTVRQTITWHVVDSNNNDVNVNVIAYDGITIAAPQNLAQVVIPAGGRVDVLLRVDDLGNYQILNGNSAEPLALLVADGPLVNMTIPASLPTPSSLPPIDPSEITETRPIVYQVNAMGLNPPYNMPPAAGFQNFTINGVRFDPSVVNEAINLGSVIQWDISNTSNVPHPHHIHIQPFYVVAINGVALQTPVWMDTINIPANGNVTVYQRFDNFPGKFVYHCHILVHEDTGMMQIVEVT